MSDKPKSELIIDQTTVYYTFKQDQRNTYIYIRVVTDNTFKSVAYKKLIHREDKKTNLDLDGIMYKYSGRSNFNPIKKIKLDTLFQNNITCFEVFYGTQVLTEVTLILGIVNKDGIKKYYNRTNLQLNGIHNSVVDLSKAQSIDEENLLDELYKENYKQNNVLTIKVDSKTKYQNITLNGPNKIGDSTKFVKYTHTPESTASNFTHLVLDCSFKCIFKDFTTSNYSNSNLREVNSYFFESDSLKHILLFIEVSCNNGSAAKYFQLTINKTIQNDPTKWVIEYKNVSFHDSSSIPSKLQQIYTETSGDFYRMCNNGDNTPEIAGGVSAAIILGGGSVAGGITYYKYPGLVLSLIGKIAGK